MEDEELCECGHEKSRHMFEDQLGWVDFFTGCPENGCKCTKYYGEEDGT